MWFTTATINSWQQLLADNENKDIIIDYLKWMHEHDRARIHAFVIMPNHFHMVWNACVGYTIEANMSNLLRFTASQYRKKLLITNPAQLEYYKSTQVDRQIHIWERRNKSIFCKNLLIVTNKIDYCHNNPTREQWKLSQTPEDYHYSSAAFYANLPSPFNFITHYLDYQAKKE
ncbi:MAG: hypothetical protein IPL12_15665 [Bacteroidetes bacterium]|nr:hypothetical protein [Bacteroidota bacterium]